MKEIRNGNIAAPSVANPVHLALFVSGSGTNCENIIRYFQNHPDVEIDLVVSNRADAYALVRAAQYDVPTCVIPRQQLEEDQRMVLQTLQGIDYIILAGFLPKVPVYLIERFPDRIINIHPALLPKFGGKGMWGHHVHEAVKAAGELHSGITIHFVNPELDEGEHIAQFSTRISPTDTADDIAEKVHRLEMAYFPQVIEQVVKGNIV